MENSKKFRPNPDLRVMDQVRQVLRYHHYAYRTEQTYSDWIRRYTRYHARKMDHGVVMIKQLYVQYNI